MRERTGINEDQRKHYAVINDMIARGQMPSMEEVRSVGAENRFSIIPRHLLESVVRKNKQLFEQRGANHAAYRKMQWINNDGVSAREIERRKAYMNDVFPGYSDVDRLVRRQDFASIVNEALDRSQQEFPELAAARDRRLRMIQTIL